MKTNRIFSILFIFTLVTLTLCFGACSNDKKPSKQTAQTPQSNTNAYKQVSPMFNADSAYFFIEKQVAFGPRIVESKASLQCADWIASKFKSYGAQVILQKGSMTNWDKRKIKVTNIIAQINPTAKKRILLTAHWDSRPYADNDPIVSNRTKPVLAADDGGSGVAVMIEVARIISENKLPIGVDFMCFDAEDLGKPEFEDSYCLGTQYWGKNIVPANYHADFAINLDMVGGKGATFIWEKNSIDQGETYLRKVWEKAALLGYANQFQYLQNGQITDDHVYVHQYTQIPAIDIIHFNPNTGFPAWWHTVNDDLNNIDKGTLKAVGQTLLEVIFTEK
jgi:Zn-dependent M28 family amino/carboxypeptidase